MIDCVPETTHRFLDGGSLLHRIPGSSEQYYGKIAKGCEEESTIKHETHQRSGYNIHTVVSFTAETYYLGKKEEIVSRDTTKQRVIRMIRVNREKDNVMCLTNMCGDAK